MTGRVAPVEAMRYRHSRYRYTAVVQVGPGWSASGDWLTPRLLVEGRWRPDVDSYESETSIEVTVDLAGVDEDDYEVQLFEDALVVEGRRWLLPRGAGGLYHTAGVRQGPFRLEVRLPSPVDGERIEAHYDRGLLRISLPKQRRPVS